MVEYTSSEQNCDVASQLSVPRPAQRPRDPRRMRERKPEFGPVRNGAWAIRILLAQGGGEGSQ